MYFLHMSPIADQTGCSGSGSGAASSVLRVAVLEGGAALLPCDMAGGEVYTVLWYRDSMGQPFYT